MGRSREYFLLIKDFGTWRRTKNFSYLDNFSLRLLARTYLPAVSRQAYLPAVSRQAYLPAVSRQALNC
jgi:hypothetical protein